MIYSNGQIASWYHSKIPRIPHGLQNPTKRYLTEPQILELFDGEVVIEEKVDGKLNCHIFNDIGIPEWWLKEDINSKNTVHTHIMKYSNIHDHVYLDKVLYVDGEYIFKPMSYGNANKYGTIKLFNPTIREVHSILKGFSKLKSHYGSDKIEGLVIKNYNKQLMGKWINDEFEDKLKVNQ